MAEMAFGAARLDDRGIVGSVAATSECICYEGEHFANATGIERCPSPLKISTFISAGVLY